MIYEISHTTTYSYSENVFFEPHQLRFKPKNTPHNLVREFSVHIIPETAGIAEQFDIEGNHNQICWFDGLHNEMKISSYAVVEVQKFNPFNFIVYPEEYLQLPFTYSEISAPLLQPALIWTPLGEPITAYVANILSQTENSSINFLAKLTNKIFEDFVLEIRDEGSPMEPGQTFELAKGSCRDLSWMQIQMLRSLGIAARFVSGYFFVEDVNPAFELHAWVEAYLPGAGWIGMDPSHGVLADYNHIPVASSAYYEHTMPVIGAIRGSASSSLHHELDIRRTS